MPNWAVGLGSPPIFVEEDDSPASFVDTPPAELRAVTVGWRTRALYAADGDANLYASDSDFANLAVVDVAGAQVNHMIRSGNIDGVVYLAVGDGTGDNGVQKWIPGVAAPFWIKRTTNACLMVGYGGVHLPIPHTDCIDVVVPDDPGTSLVPGFGPGTQIGRLTITELPFYQRFTAATTYTASVDTVITFAGNYFTAFEVPANTETNLYDLRPRNTIDGLDDAYPYTVTFCHLAPE